MAALETSGMEAKTAVPATAAPAREALRAVWRRCGLAVGCTVVRVLVTGHDGYIGAILVPLLTQAGHEVVGLDMYLYEGCGFGDDGGDDDSAGEDGAGDDGAPVVPGIRKDIRDVTASDLDGFDAVIHLAALSNDPVGHLNPDCTYAINPGHTIDKMMGIIGQRGSPRSRVNTPGPITRTATSAVASAPATPPPVKIQRRATGDATSGCRGIPSAVRAPPRAAMSAR